MALLLPYDVMSNAFIFSLALAGLLVIKLSLFIVIQPSLASISGFLNTCMDIDNFMQEVCRADQLTSQEVFNEVRIQRSQTDSMEGHYIIKFYIHFEYTSVSLRAETFSFVLSKK